MSVRTSVLSCRRATGPGPIPRRAVLAGLAASATAAAGGCGSVADGSGSTKATGWQFTDDRGRTARVPGSPTRIVAYTGTAAALNDYGLGHRIVGVFGPTRTSAGTADPLAGDLDLARVTVIGNRYGEFDLETYAGLDPQLLVTNIYQDDALWFVPDDARAAILRLAPAVGLKVAGVALPEPLRRYAALARALGADLQADPVVQARRRFEEAVSALRSAAGRRPRLRVLAASASTDTLYVSDPAAYADLSYFARLGVDLVRPTHVQGGFFENLSWENADRYPADVILLDSRTSALQPTDLTGTPTWARLPAVRAGQVTPWLSEPRFSCAGCAAPIRRLARVLRRAHRVA